MQDLSSGWHKDIRKSKGKVSVKVLKIIISNGGYSEKIYDQFGQFRFISRYERKRQVILFVFLRNKDPDIPDEKVEETTMPQLQTTTEGPPKKRSRKEKNNSSGEIML